MYLKMFKKKEMYKNKNRNEKKERNALWKSQTFKNTYTHRCYPGKGPINSQKHAQRIFYDNV